MADGWDDSYLDAWLNQSPGTQPSTPVYNGNSSSANAGGNWLQGLNLQSIINSGFGLASQIFARNGQYQTQQIGVPGSLTGIGQGYAPSSILQASGQTQQAIAAQQLAQQQALLAAQHGGVNGVGIGSSVGGGLDGAINWAASNPIPVFLGIAGVFLLFREPPRRR